MQAQEQTVTRRALDVEDYIDILRRHKSWIFGPTFAALVIGTVVAFLWPDTYVSTGMVRVVPPKIPDAYVQSNLNSDLQGRFNQMLQGVISKDKLLAIINKHGLYQRELKRMPREDVVDAMRTRDIRINPVQTLGQTTGKPALPAFQIGFACNNRQTAKDVTTQLISDLLEENQRETSGITVQTTEFLRSSWELAKRKLDGIEGQLSSFRVRNLGHLPEQQVQNFNQMTALQTQALNLNTAMSRVAQDKLIMERQIGSYKDQMAQLKDPSNQEQVSAQKNEKLIEKDREITYYESALAAARERYREGHPDVQTLLIKVAAAKKQREEIAKEDLGKKPEQVARPANPEIVRQQRDLEAAVKRVQGMMDAKDLELADYQKSLTQLNASLKGIQERLQGMPVGLKEYEELMRDRDLAKKDYEELDKKLSNSVLSSTVIKNGQGETLEVLEFASLPQTPTEPKRPIIVLAATGIGLILGLFMAGAREVKDSSLKNLKDVRAYTQLPILGSIPLLENDLIVRRRRRLGWLAWATACLVGVIVMGTSIVYYYTSIRTGV